MSEYSDSILTPFVINVLAGLLVLYISIWISKRNQKTISGRRKDRNERTGRRWSLLFAASISVLISTAATLWIIHVIHLPVKARPMFSDFSYCFPVNNYGVHWGVFNDNPYNGNSDVSIMVKSDRANVNDCYGVLIFQLGEKSTIRPYAGVFAGFAPKPMAPRDVSHFSGVKVNVWHEGAFPEGVRVYLQISPYQMINWYDGYFQSDLTEHFKKMGPSPEVVVPFENFEPSASLRGIGFNEGFSSAYRKEVYQLAIIIQGLKGMSAQGVIAFDNLIFY